VLLVVSRTVERVNNYSVSLSLAALGDVLVMPDSSRGTVRCVVRSLAARVDAFTGFLLVGEIGPDCRLLTFSPDPAVNVGVYAPQSQVPEFARNASELVSGVATYWAPHVRGISGAMSEVGYKVARVRGQLDPMVLLWRGGEMVVFVKSFDAPGDAFLLKQLPKNSRVTEVSVDRVTSVVTSPAPHLSPDQPLRAPERVPERIPAR
jgi:hypothetical protein